MTLKRPRNSSNKTPLRRVSLRWLATFLLPLAWGVWASAPAGAFGEECAINPKTILTKPPTCHTFPGASFLQSAAGDRAVATAFAPSAVPVSSFHFNMVRAMARCAGFAPEEAELIALYSQSPDQPGLARGVDDRSFEVGDKLLTLPSVCEDESALPPGHVTYDELTFAKHPLGGPKGRTVVPTREPLFPAKHPDLTYSRGRFCFLDRNGVSGQTFHFPTRQDLDALRSWAKGLDGADPRTVSIHPVGVYSGSPQKALMREVAYTVCKSQKVRTTVPGGTLAALGVYLHALADHHSHHECIGLFDEWNNNPDAAIAKRAGEKTCATVKEQELFFPLHTVTVGGPQKLANCYLTHHLREFGQGAQQFPASTAARPVSPDPQVQFQHTFTALRAVWDELKTAARERGLQSTVAAVTPLPWLAGVPGKVSRTAKPTSAREGEPFTMEAVWDTFVLGQGYATRYDYLAQFKGYLPGEGAFAQRAAIADGLFESCHAFLGKAGGKPAGKHHGGAKAPTKGGY